jgi:hypothetical protein
MTIDERLLYLTTLQQSHYDEIAKLVEQGNLNTVHIAALTQRMDASANLMDVLTERTIQAMDAINRLGRIADNHENRIDGLEDQRPS